ncbi:MAG TPA: response regulator [Candidatus Cybelea sp.]|jgi:two-component system, sensor histidine kinase and response regulator|nr:response regulator [Candidatus Cybelea sp.]
MHILVADDDAGNRELLTELLRHGGHSVTAVPGGRESLAAIAKDTFEIVLMDEEMPGMSGLEATRAILQTIAPGQKRPIIVGISGNSTDEDEQRCLAAGMDAFLAKPVRAAELFSLLAALARRQAAPSSEQVNSAAPDLPPDNLAETLRRATGGNETIARLVVKTFLSDTPKKLASLRRAASTKDAETLATVAHSLKGSLALIGAQKAAGTARNLQAMGRLGNLSGAAAEFRVLEGEFEELRLKLLALHAKTDPASTPASGRTSVRTSPIKPKTRRTRSHPRRKR